MTYRKAQVPNVEVIPESGGGTQRRITHPSFATVRVSRVSGGDTVLFDSSIKHNGYITMTFMEAEMTDNGYRHSVMGHGREFFQVAMTENQFVAMVTRMNVGSGVPVTIQHRQIGPLEITPSIATFESSAESLGRMANDVDDSVREQVRERVATLKGMLEGLPKKKAEAISNLIDIIVAQSKSNMDYGHVCLKEKAEKLVTEAKVEIDAHVSGVITQLGVDSLQHLSQLAAAARTGLIGKDE